MKEFLISVVVSIIVVILGFVWLSKASQDYLEKNPEIAEEAKSSMDSYNESVERHNQKIAKN